MGGGVGSAGNYGLLPYGGVATLVSFLVTLLLG
jgi:hypothetical protein